MSSPTRQHRLKSDAGVALLLAVWLLALLAVIVGEFVFSTRVRVAAERNKRDDLRAWSLAIAGYRAALAALDDDKLFATSVAADDDVLLLHYRGESGGTRAAAKDVALGGGTYSWRIIDETGLVSVNEVKRSVLTNVLKLCGVGPGADRDTVIDSIIDWRDTGREHRLNGAEEDYYRSLDPPYSCKDDRFDVIEELLLVRGVTPALFFGTGEGDKRMPGLRDLLSAHAQDSEPNRATAPKALLEALSHPRTPRSPPSGLYRIVATGDPGGGAPKRTVQAIVQTKATTGSSRTFALLYWNDISSPEPLGREGTN